MGFNGIGHFADLFGPSTTTAVEQMFHHQQQQQQQQPFQLQQQHPVYEECCVPTGDCVMRSAPIRPDDPRAAELYARVACSDSGCPAGRYMHRECFDAWERLVLAFMKNAAATAYSAGGRVKDLWTVNVNNNNVVNLNQKGYDMAFKACACRCGRGYLRKDTEWPSSEATLRRRSSGGGGGGFADDADAGTARSAAGKKKKRRPSRTAVPSCAVAACAATAMSVDYADLRLRAGSLSGSSNGSSSPVTGGSNSTAGSSVSPAHSGSFGSGSTTGTSNGSNGSFKRRGANASSSGSCFKDVFER